MTESYGPEARARFVAEPPKRSDRTEFERDRARILHSSALRRLSAKTQVLGPGFDDFVRNRLTHSLEVAQVARELGGSLGCNRDIVESAALAHDLGHPPFGHNGEVALDEAASAFGGFEGNAQTLRLLTRLEGKTFDDGGLSVGLNLTRATLSACVKYPWRRGERPGSKFGVYDDDEAVFAWLSAGSEPGQRPIEAQVMDLADDIAYSVHDVEDGVVGRWFTLGELDEPGIYEAADTWYGLEDHERAAQALGRLRALPEWPQEYYDGSRPSLAGLKSLTSAIIGRFVTAAREATVDRWGTGPLVRFNANLEVPDATLDEITVLKAVAVRHVMTHHDREPLLARQRELLSNLVAVLSASEDEHLDSDFAADFRAASSDDARSRVIIDQVASLTDLSANLWAERLL